MASRWPHAMLCKCCPHLASLTCKQDSHRQLTFLPQSGCTPHETDLLLTVFNSVSLYYSVLFSVCADSCLQNSVAFMNSATVPQSKSNSLLSTRSCSSATTRDPCQCFHMFSWSTTDVGGETGRSMQISHLKPGWSLETALVGV